MLPATAHVTASAIDFQFTERPFAENVAWLNGNHLPIGIAGGNGQSLPTPPLNQMGPKKLRRRHAQLEKFRSEDLGRAPKGGVLLHLLPILARRANQQPRIVAAGAKRRNIVRLPAETPGTG